MPSMPRPQRPNVESKNANRLMDWVEVLAYVFWVGFLIAAGILLLVHGGAALDIKALLAR